ncbi:MAG: hypothetical protein U5L96_18915 [Owenweeksia sp.]|nr:hypothetical protein [Owenweeksia sp.]
MILGLVIPFDIRDESLDDASMRTLPQVIGVPAARHIALFGVGLYQVWLLLRVVIFDWSLVRAVSLSNWL